MYQPPIVAFVGRAGSGKSTAASGLVAAGFERVKFAGPLKEMFAAFLRFTGYDDATIHEMIEGSLKEHPQPVLGGHSPRYFMQTLGTEFGREKIAPDLWVQAWAQRVMDLREKGVPVVCDDCRFPNEAAMVRELGGVLVCVEGKTRTLQSFDHESEQHDIEADETIVNFGTVNDLQTEVIEMFQPKVRRFPTVEARDAKLFLGTTVAPDVVSYQEFTADEFQAALEEIDADGDLEGEIEEVVLRVLSTPTLDDAKDVLRSYLNGEWDDEDEGREQIVTLIETRKIADGAFDRMLYDIPVHREVTKDEALDVARAFIRADGNNLAAIRQFVEAVDGVKICDLDADDRVRLCFVVEAILAGSTKSVDELLEIVTPIVEVR